MFNGIGFVPFFVGIGLFGFLASIVLVVFWFWMIVDCIRRKFNQDVEKLIWVLVMLFSNWLGAFAYFIFIKILHKKGIYNIVAKDFNKKGKKKR